MADKMTTDEAMELISNAMRGSVGDYHDALVRVYRETGTLPYKFSVVNDLAWVERCIKLEDRIEACKMKIIDMAEEKVKMQKEIEQLKTKRSGWIHKSNIKG